MLMPLIYPSIKMIKNKAILKLKLNTKSKKKHNKKKL